VINLKVLLVLLTLFILCNNQKLLAQLSAIHDFIRADNVILVSENNDTLIYPFAGGLNSCQIMNMDLNLDGIDDLLVFDRHGNRILPFIVLPSTPGKYRFAPELATFFPPIEQWMQAIDYNNDGKKDIFTYTTGGIKVYKNESGSKLKFTQVTNPFLYSLQGTTLTNILVTSADYPAIADIDGDGDMDVLSFWTLGTYVEWHRNTSRERFGHADSLTFERSSSCWGHFAEGIEDNTVILNTCVSAGKSAQVAGTRTDDDPKHTGSTLLINDLNGDGLPDLALGDVDFSTLVQLTNGGSIADTKMISQTSSFPNSKDPVNMNLFPAAMLTDTDNDGQKDLLVSPFDPSLVKGENFKSISLYHNTRTNKQPAYQLASKSYIQDEMLDLGSGAYPVFFDYNGDGLMDLLVGNYGYTDSCFLLPDKTLKCSYTSKIALLLNEGTLIKPKFRLANRNIARLDTLHLLSLIPSVADLDGDGDMDLVCGNSFGKLNYCENIALPGLPAEFKLAVPPWQGIDVGDFSAPQLFDMDQDGLTDLICGKRNGTISYYKNTGSKQEAQYTLITELLGGVDVTNAQLSNYGYSVPCFYNDKQGDIKLFCGSEYGEVFVYDQIKNNLNGNFRLVGILPGIKEGWRSGVAIDNLNNDTLTDMLVGNYSGGMGLFFGKPDKIFGIGEKISKLIPKLTITPNPARGIISVDFPMEKTVTPELLVITDIQGNVIAKYYPDAFPFLIDVSGYKNGVYMVMAYANKGFASAKLVICW